MLQGFIEWLVLHLPQWLLWGLLATFAAAAGAMPPIPSAEWLKVMVNVLAGMNQTRPWMTTATAAVRALFLAKRRGAGDARPHLPSVPLRDHPSSSQILSTVRYVVLII